MQKTIPRPLLVGTTICYPTSASPRFTLERALEGLARTGLRYVELVAIPDYCSHLEPERMGVREIEAVRRLLARYDICAVAINVAADLTTEAGVATLGSAMRVARALDAGTIVTAIHQTGTPEGLARFVEQVPSILSLAERYDVVVALETHRGRINTGVGGAALLREIGAERLKLTYDMANVLNRGGVLPEDDLAAMGEDIGRYIAYVHLKEKATREIGDRNFPPFGTGVLDFGAVLARLYAGGYRGPMSLEVELDGKPASAEVVDEALIHSAAYLERFWTNPSSA